MENFEIIEVNPEIEKNECYSGLISTFLNSKKSKTIRSYANDIRDFSEFLGCDSPAHTAKILLTRGQGEANSLLLSYRSQLSSKGLSPATINRRLSAIRSLSKLARLLGLISWTIEIDGLKSEKYRDTRGPQDDVVAKMICATKNREDQKGLRDEAIIRLLYDLALRRGEVCSIDIEHVNLQIGTVSVLGKGRNERIQLTLPSKTKEALARWIEIRGRSSGALFIALDNSSKGHRLTGEAIWKIVAQTGASIGYHVRPHGLRHSAITKALDLTSGDVRKVQRFSRHRDIRVLTVYDDSRRDMAGEVASLIANTV